MTIPSQHAQMLPPQSSLARPPQYGPLPSQVPPYPPPPYGATRTTTYYWPQQYEQRQPQYVHRPQATHSNGLHIGNTSSYSLAHRHRCNREFPNCQRSKSHLRRRLYKVKHSRVLLNSRYSSHCRTHCQYSNRNLHSPSQQPLKQGGLAREHGNDK
ncbi:hypothetical protein TYRP_011423 [Tyrophagus putrescentiae]|nr:hypothetical protein TYRP_011423 [Tyrophagus putrescentiae]